jgi:short-subunit dehydrogenase
LKRIFITGASSGLGEAFALQVAGPDVHLGLVARRADRLAAVREACMDKGAEVKVLVQDVTDTAGMKRAADDYLAWAGGADLVLANAGVAIRDRARKGDATDAARVISVNLVGTVNAILPFVPAMVEEGDGILAATSSVAAFRPVPYLGAYSASKAGILAFMESLRVNLGGSGVHAMTVCPGYVCTALSEGAKKLPFGLQPEEAAREMARGIRKRKKVHTFPWQMATIKSAMGIFPDSVMLKAAPGRPD